MGKARSSALPVITAIKALSLPALTTWRCLEFFIEVAISRAMGLHCEPKAPGLEHVSPEARMIYILRVYCEVIYFKSM